MTYKGLNNERTVIIHGGDYQFCPEGITGPGPECLIGYTASDDKGFFGEVTGSELITMSSLTSQLGVTQGTAQNTSSPWLKFYLDGRILYVTKKPIRHNISYGHLRDLNLVDGSKIITINGLQYRVGLLGGIDDGYDGNVSAGYNQPYTMRSEWTRLMYNVTNTWVSYPQDDSVNGLNISTGNGRFSWCKELNPTRPDQAVVRGHISVTHVFPDLTTNANAGNGWRPMLELVQ